MEHRIVEGDCLEVMRGMEDASVDSLVCDPPAGISFMGKSWDSDKGSRNNWIAWLTEVMEEALRVMKPGAHGLVWALPRTSHWTAMALEDAGFEVRDRIAHVYGSGFPKSLNVSKALNKMAGAEREKVGEGSHGKGSYSQRMSKATGFRPYVAGLPSENNGGKHDITAPATEAAREWDGWGTALKPATEDWWLVRKPLSESSVARQVLSTGTGAINVDASRVGSEQITQHGRSDSENRAMSGRNYAEPAGRSWSGRFPANLILSHSPECVRLGEKRVKGGTAHRTNGGGNTFGGDSPKPPLDDMTYTDPDGYETTEAYRCHPSCPVGELDRQSGTSKSPKATRRKESGTDFGRINDDGWQPSGCDINGYADNGGASRFFQRFPAETFDAEPGFQYVAKSSRRERNAGLEGMPEKPVSELDKFATNPQFTDLRMERQQQRLPKSNHHPTVKPLKLMSYLVRLITPPGGTVLDPFAGSGSTGCAAVLEGFSFVGVERESEYVEIARRRIEHHKREGAPERLQTAEPLPKPKRKAKSGDQLRLDLP